MTERAEFLSTLRSTVEFPVTEDVVLGDLMLTVRAATPSFSALRYFSAGDPAPPPRLRGRCAFYWLPEEALPGRVLDQARRLVDTTFRAQRFADGFYLTHHHSRPAMLFVEDDATYVVGGDPDKVVWSYFVKVALTRHAWRTDQLHLKAGALVVAGRTVLVTGPGSAGKTFFTLQATGSGANLLSNTHVLLAPEITTGVATAIRVRPDPAYDWLLRRVEVSRHYERSDVIVDPRDVGIAVPRTAEPPAAILVMDYSASGRRRVRPLAPSDSRAMLEHFAWPMNVYGMKYDVWQMVGSTPSRLRRYLDAEAGRLSDLVARAPTLLVDWELGGPHDVPELIELVLATAVSAR